MENQLRIERLTELQGMLTHHHLLFKEVGFYMGHWFSSEADCGTAACALGSACLHKPFIEQGLSLNNVKHSAHPLLNGDSHNLNGFAVGREFFGITNDESIYLFGVEGSYGKPSKKITTQDVAERVGILINKYKGEIV